jgi:hypothetical protein
MFRIIPTALLVAGFVACTKDTGPTTPSAGGLKAVTTIEAEREDEGDGGGRPTADDVEASIVINHVHLKFRECDGEDGHYFQTRNVFSGVSTGDSRLSGNIEIRVRDLFNATQNLGPQLGRVVITDAGTGRIKAEGDYSNWGPEEFVQGTIVGVVKDRGLGAEPTSGAGKWAANWRLSIRPDVITAQIGGVATDNRIPAGLWQGGCSGKWTEDDVDLGSAGIAASAVKAGQSWRAPRL